MLTSLLDLVNNKATAAAGLQNVPLATPKHHGPEGRNDLQISQEQVPWGPQRPFWNPTRNLLFSYPAIVLEASLILLSSFFETQPKRQNTTYFRAENDAKSIARTSFLEAGTSLLKSY